MGDNVQCIITATGEETFSQAFELAWKVKDYKKASHYKIDPSYGMIFYWSGASKETALPYEMTVKAAAAFAYEWLKTVDFGREPDHDGSNGKGFTISTGDGWGHINDNFYGILYVKPQWIMYGK